VLEHRVVAIHEHAVVGVAGARRRTDHLLDVLAQAVRPVLLRHRREHEGHVAPGGLGDVHRGPLLVLGLEHLLDHLADLFARRGEQELGRERVEQVRDVLVPERAGFRVLVLEDPGERAAEQRHVPARLGHAASREHAEEPEPCGGFPVVVGNADADLVEPARAMHGRFDAALPDVDARRATVVVAGAPFAEPGEAQRAAVAVGGHEHEVVGDQPTQERGDLAKVLALRAEAVALGREPIGRFLDEVRDRIEVGDHPLGEHERVLDLLEDGGSWAGSMPSASARTTLIVGSFG
jgi:hypothetical protein